MKVWIRKVRPNAIRMRIGSSTQNGRLGLVRLAERSRQAATLAAWSTSDPVVSDPSAPEPAAEGSATPDSTGPGAAAAPDRAGPDWAAAVGAGRLTAGSAATGAVSGPSAAVLRESCSVIVRQATVSGRARGPAPAVDPVSHVGRSAQPPAGPFVVLDPSAGDAVRDDPQPAVLLAGRPRARPARPGAIGQ